MTLEPLGWIYDFKRDRWVESRSLRRSWDGGELPPAPEAPAFGRWTAPAPLARSFRPLEGRKAALGLLLTGPGGCALLAVHPAKLPTAEDARLITIPNDHGCSFALGGEDVQPRSQGPRQWPPFGEE